MKRFLMSLAVAALIAICSFASRGQEPAKKPVGKHAESSGQYRFDPRTSGAGPFTARVYEENGALYIWAETSDSPDRMSPVEDSPTKFSLELPNQGRWSFEFLRDEKGQFTRWHIVNIDLGIDTVGTKIDNRSLVLSVGAGSVRLLPEQALIVHEDDFVPLLGDLGRPEELFTIPVRDQLEI